MMMADTATTDAPADKQAKRRTAERLDALEHENLLIADAIAGTGQYGKWAKQEILRLRAGLPEEAATA